MNAFEKKGPWAPATAGRSPAFSPPPQRPRQTDPVAEAMAETVEEGARAPQLLTPPEVAKLLNVSVRTLERWRMTGEGPSYVRLSRKQIRYTEVAVVKFIRGSERTNTAQ